MLADAEDVEPHLVGELDLFQQIPQSLILSDQMARAGIPRALRERVDAEFHDHSCLVRFAAEPQFGLFTPLPRAGPLAEVPG